MKDLKWWCWSQNNSGGEFIVNDVVAHYVWIQAHSLEEAENARSNITEDHDWWCDCCGVRWEWEPDQNEGVDEPDLVKYGSWRNFAVLHYALGHVKKVELK